MYDEWASPPVEIRILSEIWMVCLEKITVTMYGLRGTSTSESPIFCERELKERKSREVEGRWGTLQYWRPKFPFQDLRIPKI
jgi:hypothetical protein